MEKLRVHFAALLLFYKVPY